MAGFRRIYPDFPGMGRTVAPRELRSAEDVLDTLFGFAGVVTSGSAYLLVGHSVGAYCAQAMAARAPRQVAGLALVCPLLPLLLGSSTRRLDSVVGYAAAADLSDHYPHASLVVVDDAGHALPHEQPDLLRALVAEWLQRDERAERAERAER
jgi:pimeloyl-ACP methyl ester carboxylesterase